MIICNFWETPYEGITQWNVEGRSQFSPCQKRNIFEPEIFIDISINQTLVYKAH